MPSLSASYRPQTFADVTGQEPVTETLRREIETGKIGHAYLFAGPRGIGKTTTARIFAKALNCLEPSKGEPCNSCDSCRDVNNGSSLDVIEMDAASNTGVDNVRTAIIEHVRFIPQRKHKIYILDEAHMLSGSAWNALLKTIEEPPAYAVFLFLTTEQHKVPATIVSRCQRFDFHRIKNEALTERIDRIAQNEGVSVASDVVKTIVARSDGCLRDAESLLSQLLVLGEKKITADVASLVLPISRLPIAAELLEIWSKRSLGPSLARIQELEEQGVSLLPLFDDLIQAIRFLLLASDSVEWRSKLANGDEGERDLAALVTAFDAAELSEMALMLMERRRDAKQGADASFCLELAASAVALRLLPHGGTPSSPTSKEGDRSHFVPFTHSTQFVTPAKAGDQDRKDTPILDSRLRGNDKKITEASHERRATSDEPDVAAPITLALIQQKWPAFLRAMDEKSKSLVFVLKITHPASVTGTCVTFCFQYPFHKEKIIGDMKARRLVEDCLRDVLGVPLVTVEGIVELETEESKEARSQDMVTNILKAFGGQIVENNDTPGHVG